MEKMEIITPMKFEQNIVLNSINFTLIKIQRDDISAIYKSEDKTKILRIGEKQKIKKDLANHKKLIEQGYPVSQIIEEGEVDGRGYFIEKSLGEKLFGQLFKSDFEQAGKVSDDNFDLLISESKKTFNCSNKKFCF